MKQENIDKIHEILRKIPITNQNEDIIEEIREHLANEEYNEAVEKLRELNTNKNNKQDNENEEEQEEMEEYEEEYNNGYDEIDEGYEEDNQEEEYDDEDYEEDDDGVEEQDISEEDNREIEKIYPDKISDIELENIYIGLLLNNPKLISKYYYLNEECLFEDPQMLNIYKSVLFTEGEAYASEKAKRGFNFAKETEEAYKIKSDLRKEMAEEDFNMEDIFIELKKLFVLRKKYVSTPELETQIKIVDITDYVLYDEMSVEEVENAINQVDSTSKFKRAILNKNLSDFLKLGDNNLTNGLELPFNILSNVFKGIRKGETMAYAMPSNSGKSRFTINLATYTAFLHKQKVLIISNEMSEEKMRLCLITTILNNPEIKKIHGQDISKTEGELLEFKYRPDDKKGVEVDENGFVLKKEGESQKDFVKRLSQISSEFNMTIETTDWVNKEMKNSIYFINITDHTNEELKKVIMNYYYKEKIEYVFYDTLKTDTANIGNGEEIKRTATILSNLAQNFGMFICSTLQLAESSTLPINLDVNDLAVSRTVKEVLDTLCLIKQINRDNYEEYEYSLKEVDTKFDDIEKSKDPDVRYYACVVDKNRAGAKPTVLFRLNLAYNMWEELGYLRMKQK